MCYVKPGLNKAGTELSVEARGHVADRAPLSRTGLPSGPYVLGGRGCCLPLGGPAGRPAPLSPGPPGPGVSEIGARQEAADGHHQDALRRLQLLPRPLSSAPRHAGPRRARQPGDFWARARHTWQQAWLMMVFVCVCLWVKFRRKRRITFLMTTENPDLSRVLHLCSSSISHAWPSHAICHITWHLQHVPRPTSSLRGPHPCD